MAITKFIPEVWAAELLATLEKSLVFGGVANRNYEGDIANMGDTVHIVSVAAPSISTYIKDTDLTIETLTDAELTLLIDQAKSFAFEVDDIDDRQSRQGGALMAEAAAQAAYGLRDVADQYLAAKAAVEASATNTISVVDASSTAKNVYDKVFVPMRTKLSKANVPTEGRWAVVDPAVYGVLLLDDRFVKANESGDGGALHNGRVGSAAGFTVYESNNAPNPTRSITATVTVATTAKTLTAAAGTFNQGDKGMTVSGTRITEGSKIDSVNADGSVATMDTAGASAGTQTDTALAGADSTVIAGSSIGLTYAEQISKVEAFRPEKRFADALKGLHLYGAKVPRPLALTVASVKTSA